jgi:DNA-binding transcriptional ArsR family regulator
MPRARADSSVFQAIADPTRRGVLDALREGERGAGELGGLFEMSQPAMSQHLKVLLEAGLVEQRREGRARIYRLAPDRLRAVRDWVSHYDRFWDEKLAALRRYLDSHQPATGEPPGRNEKPMRSARSATNRRKGGG